MCMAMFFIAWLFETPWYIGMGLIFLGIVMDFGCWTIGEIIENKIKKFKKGIDK